MTYSTPGILDRTNAVLAVMAVICKGSGSENMLMGKFPLTD